MKSVSLTFASLFFLLMLSPGRALSQSEREATTAQVAAAIDATWQARFFDEHEHGMAWDIVEVALPFRDFERAYRYDQAGMTLDAAGAFALGSLKTGLSVVGMWEGRAAITSFLRVSEHSGRRVFLRVAGSNLAGPEVTAVRGGIGTARPSAASARTLLDEPLAVEHFVAAGMDRSQAEHILGLLRSNRPVYNMAAREGGRLGGAAHRAKVREIVRKLQERGWEIVGGGGVAPEKLVRVPGRARGRFPDITATRGGKTLRIQIGRSTKAGHPVAREARALDDIWSIQGRGDHTFFVTGQPSAMRETYESEMLR